MPLPSQIKTSKKIIASIKSQKKSFTVGSISEDLNRSAGRKAGQRKKKKGKSRKKQKEIETILSILYVLTTTGFLSRKKKSFTRKKPLTLEGRLFLNSSGNGIIRTEDGDEIHIRRDSTGTADNRDLVKAEIIDFRRGYLLGRVIDIREKERELFFGRVSSVRGNYVFFSLMDTPAEKIMCAEVSGEVSAEIRENPDAAIFLLRAGGGEILSYPRCEMITAYRADEETADFQRISIKHSLPGPHPDYQELEHAREELTEKKGTDRKDYRGMLTVTIDGDNAKDFDDAVSLVTEGDRYHLSVHIADVSNYVGIDTPLDREALNRGTSYYIGNSVIPMLPEILSNDLCSLVEGEERLTLSVEMTFDGKGNLLSAGFHEGIILVDRRLTYNRGADILAEGRDEKLFPLLSQMYNLAAILKKKRLGRGSIDLNLRDIEIIYEEGKFRELAVSRRLKSHEIIEEFMLSANIAAALLLKKSEFPSLYRNHERISDENITLLKEFLKLYNIAFGSSGNLGLEIQKILKKVKGLPSEQVINMVVLKSMMQAFYGAEPLGHFGLGFENYTHFTSPIRRYPDLVVHRCIKAIIGKSSSPYTFERIVEMGERSSEQERVAQDAERDMIKLKSCRFMEGREGDIFSGIISGVTRFGIFVSLDEYPVEGLLPLRFLTDDYYLLEEDKFRIISKKYSKRFTIGDSIRVKLFSVDIDRLRIDFQPEK